MKLERGQRCQICTHPKREQIEHSVIETDNKRVTAKKFKISYYSLEHHFQKHVPKSLELAAAARKVRLGDNMLEEIELLHETTMQILTEAREGQPLVSNGVPVLVGGKPVMVSDHRAALAAIKEARGNIELTAKLSGKLQPEAAAAVSFTFEHLQVLYLGLKEKGAIV
jgi:hypothetical protein